MKTLFVVAALAVTACKAPKPPAPEVPLPEAPVSATDPNRVEKYVGGLQTGLTRAQEAKAKADAATKSSQEAEKLPE